MHDTMTFADTMGGEMVAHRRPSGKHNIAWSTSNSFTGKPGEKRVNFSWELHVQEFDIQSPPHACNPHPYLDMSMPDDEGRPVQHFTFDLEEYEKPADVENARPIFFEFNVTDPEWVDQGEGVRARFLFVRHDVESSQIEGVLFVENRGPEFVFGATHKAFVRFTTDGWNSYQDVNAMTRSLAAFDALHRFFVKMPRDLASGAAIEFAICYQIGDREYWDNHHGRNYRAVVGWSS